MTEHLTYESLVALAQGIADRPVAADAFGHLAYCVECSDRWRAVRELRADFDTAWQEFASRGAALEISRSAARFPLLRVTLDSIRRVARIVLEGTLRRGISVESIAHPAGAGAGEPTAATPIAELRLAAADLGVATVIVDAQRQVISALLEPPSGLDAATLLAEKAPRLVLRSIDRGERRNAAFTLVEAAPYLLAELESGGAVEWLVAIEGR